MSGRKAREARADLDERDELEAEAASFDETKGDGELTFEQKVFERLRKESENFVGKATDEDWKELWESYEEEIASDRLRAYTFILYPDPGVVERFWSYVTQKCLQGCISPLHDSDYWPDGTPKSAHYHVLLYFPGKTTADKVRKFVNALGGKMVQPVLNITGLTRYFAHMDIDPDRRPCDVGKVHYSPDDIVSFGGFDHETHIRATKAQMSRALAELREIVRTEGITAYCDLWDLIDEELVEYQFIMSNRNVASEMGEYIRSRYAKTHAGQERKAQARQVLEQRRQIRDQAMQIAELRGMILDATAQVTRLAGLITGEVED